MEPISLIASQDEKEDSNIDSLIPIKITETVDYQEILLNEGTVLYAIQDENKEYHIPLYDSLTINISESQFEFIHNEEVDLPKNISMDEVEFLGENLYFANDVFINEDDEQAIIINDAEVSLPTHKLGDEIGLYIGYRLFVYENSESDNKESTEEGTINDGIQEEDLNESEKSEENDIEEDSEVVTDQDDIQNSEEETTETVDSEETDTGESPADVEEGNEKQKEEVAIASFKAQASSSKIQVQAADPWANSNAKYFEVVEDNLAVFDNRSGSLVKIGELTRGQTYPIVSDYGNWHRIQIGTYYGYVWKNSTIPSQQSAIKNENNSYTNQQRTVTAVTDVTVYDNSSGSLVGFGKLSQGTSIALVSDYGNWWRVIFADRVGYISKSGVKTDFQKGDKFFKVTTSDAPVYDNRTGKLVQVGSLTKGQVYPIDKDYGNWWRIKFSNYYGYIHKNQTEYADNNLKNINTTYKNSSRTLTPLSNVPVYDNSSGKLVQFGTIQKGVKYHIASDYGSNWWRIIYADRIGYVAKSSVKASFLSSDKYFVANSDLPIFDNRTGELIQVGELVEGQEYAIVSSYGSWWRINFSNHYGYVYKSGTDPVTNVSYKNSKGNFSNSSKLVKTARNTTVYDNTSGKLVPFGEISSDVVYPIVSSYGSWWRILFNDRVGYIHKNDTQDTIITRTTYNLSFNQALNIQMTANPKSDGAGNKKASKEQVSSYLNPANFVHGSASFYQFLLLDQFTYTKATELNSKFLRTNTQAGSLQGQGAAFIEAANRYGINEVYLVAHTLHETGNGKSTLASGVSRWTQMVPGTCKPVKDKNGKNVIIDISPRKVYNMYGIQAFDDCPTNAGAQYAYDNGWFTPSAAIVGGAYFIKNGYIERGQNTLYKMRWDPESAARTGRYGKQYATHIAWADIQARSIARMYNQLTGFFLQYDVPQYSDQPSTSQPSTNLYRVSTSSSGLNARSTPGGNRVLSIPKDTLVSVALNSNGGVVSQQANGLTWYQINYNGQQLWVASNYLTKVN
ncbi:hypothetical protein GCM10008924_24250 [Gracilibacillus halotolerans]